MGTKAKEGKDPRTSKTVWFGIVCIALGMALAILDVLLKAGTMDAGVISTISGILSIILRFKTTAALVLGIDDPTTPEDESKGERAHSETGFVMARLLVLIAALSFAVVSLTGCAHLTPREQQAITASVDCATKLMSAAQTCMPECIAKQTAPEQKECAIQCTLETAETAAPICAQAYGDIHSPQLGVAVRSAVESAFMIYRAVEK